MAVAPSSASRGQIIVQPSYFTSSAFVDDAREDVASLIQYYIDQYEHARPMQPFILFKDVWVSQGWTWIHFKVFDARSREAFLRVVMRLFTERMTEANDPLCRVTALFGLYTFFNTQPSVSVPKLHSFAHVEVACDLYDAIMHLPNTLDTEYLAPLRPHAIYILSELAGVFHILPHSRVHPLNPRDLPRELVVEDMTMTKKGRPSKREKKKKAKDSLVALNKWLVRTKQSYELAGGSGAGEQSGTMTSHVLLSQRPVTTRAHYRWCKSELLDELSSEDDVGAAALRRVNEIVARRMRKMDEAAAARGLEVGCEGGDRTGLGRVERAVGELGDAARVGERGGLLCLMDGAGLI